MTSMLMELGKDIDSVNFQFNFTFGGICFEEMCKIISGIKA